MPSYVLVVSDCVLVVSDCNYNICHILTILHNTYFWTRNNRIISLLLLLLLLIVVVVFVFVFVIYSVWLLHCILLFLSLSLSILLYIFLYSIGCPCHRRGGCAQDPNHRVWHERGKSREGMHWLEDQVLNGQDRSQGSYQAPDPDTPTNCSKESLRWRYQHVRQIPNENPQEDHWLFRHICTSEGYHQHGHRSRGQCWDRHRRELEFRI